MRREFFARGLGADNLALASFASDNCFGARTTGCFLKLGEAAKSLLLDWGARKPGGIDSVRTTSVAGMMMRSPDLNRLGLIFVLALAIFGQFAGFPVYQCEIRLRVSPG